jgi:hypothetical protein
VLQPGASGVGEEQGEVADDEVVIVRSTQLAGQPVVREPHFRSRLPRVLCGRLVQLLAGFWSPEAEAAPKRLNS